MNTALKMIKFPWEFASSDDTCFICDDSDGLDVWFMVYLGDEKREKAINDYLVAFNLDDELDIPDKVGFSAGYAMAHFKFDNIGKLVRTIRESIPNDGDYVNGVYEEFNEENKWVRYVFLGHDWALSVFTKEYTLYYEDMPGTPK